MKYHYVDKDNLYMKIAYQIAKCLYLTNKWNLKTTPICIIVKDNAIISVGISGNGMHPLTANCDRLNKPGSDYSLCKYCTEAEHAEIRAISELKTDPKGARCYLYSHYYACENCIAKLAEIGIRDIVLLYNSDILFDRHKEGTVIGSPDQFEE